ncbi:hypothetical protein [Lentzea sp.]|uniref:hypothetical protein n=1 Tax=Lentzea sp. TaxID=56099 RepID=UPI002BB93539|nr:hypothetical protein [Lentzea sp.]HUQ61733.1 hypothetical protein [Lentzea sp.]
MVSGDLVDGVAEELHRVARRGLPRVFPNHDGEPPLALPELRKAADRIFPGAWNVAALDRVLRRGTEALDGSFGTLSRSEAALVLFNLDDRANPDADYQSVAERLARKSGITGEAATRELVRALAEVLAGQVPALRIKVESRDNIASVLATLDGDKAVRPAARGRTLKPATAVTALVAAVALTVGATIAVVKLAGRDRGSDGDLKTASPSSQPVKIQDVTTFRSSRQDMRYVLSQAVSEPPPKGIADNEEAAGESFDSWYSAHGGTALESGFTNITVQGNDSTSVRITDMKIQANCIGPLTGAFLEGYTQGGDQDTIKIGFNLEAPNPFPEQMTVLDNNLQGTGFNYFAARTVELDPGETEVLTIGVRTKKGHCTFKLQLVVATANGTVLQEIDAPGKRFAVTAMATAESAEKPYSGYQKVYRQDDTLSWNSIDPKSPPRK